MRKKLRLVDGGPGFELVEDGKVLHRVTCGPAPTYEQACVSIMRTARAVEIEGSRLQGELVAERCNYTNLSAVLCIWRAARGPSAEFKRRTLRRMERKVCEALDNLWAAQEAYRAWEQLYGDA